MKNFFRMLFGVKDPWRIKLKVKFFHKNAKVPVYGHADDVCCDLYVVDKYYDKMGNTCYRTGLGFAIPVGFGGFIFPRSSISDTDLRLANAVGVIDPSYRGEVKLKYRNSRLPVLTSQELKELGKTFWLDNEYEIGDRAAQLVLIKRPLLEFEVVDKLDYTVRGTGGFGSTGKN